jgi:hypothetical protein
MTQEDAWPKLAMSDWHETYSTLQRWLQIVGKVRIALSPPQNHYWHSALYLTSRGLTTSPMPYGAQTLEVKLDFVDHLISLEMSDGRRQQMQLVGGTVADFFVKFMALLSKLEVRVHLWPVPVEREDVTPLDRDERPAPYDPLAAHRNFRVLSQVDQTLKIFMGRFVGKQSPSHFFWGSFDLAQTRFSGRRAPLLPKADPVEQESYSHEVMSFGFWPGTQGVSDAALYAYAKPEPLGFRQARLVPQAVSYNDRFAQFLLPYEAIRAAPSPRDEILAFFQSAYEAGARLGKWAEELSVQPHP